MTTQIEPHSLQGWTQCDRLGCGLPMARSFGSQYLCERHLAVELVPLQRKHIYDFYGVSWDNWLGIARYDSPAYGHPAGYVFVRCDVSTCSATWVSRYAHFEPCPWCLARAKYRNRQP
jgi:hypothetical protein